MSGPRKAMVLAAGLGVRMRPLTLLLAKPVLPVLGRPLLHHTLEQLAEAGVADVIVNLHHLPQTVRASVGDGRQFGLRIRYSREPRILGTGGGPRRVREFFGDEPFLLVNGDVLFDFDLGALFRRHVASGARATLALKPNPDPARYGPVVTGPDGLVRSLAGRPRRARGVVSLFTGVHVLDPALLERLPAGPSDSVRDLYAPFVGEGGRILGVRVRGAWYDLGDPAAYLASQLRILSRGFRGTGRRGAVVASGARVSPRARVEASVIGRGAAVGEGATIVRSVVWPGVRVGKGARVSGSILATGVSVGPGEEVSGAVWTPDARGTL